MTQNNDKAASHLRSRLRMGLLIFIAACMLAFLGVYLGPMPQRPLFTPAPGHRSPETITATPIAQAQEKPAEPAETPATVSPIPALHDENLTPEQQAEKEQLEAIGYLPGGGAMPKKTGVTIYQKGLTCDGPNLYVSGHAPEANLIDMEGQVLHRWRYAFNEVWPGRPAPEQGYGHLNWRRACVCENGDLLAIFEGVGLIRLNKDSKLLWAYSGLAHHDLKVLANGEIYVLTRQAHLVPRINPERLVLEDFITVLDANGNPRRHVSLLDAFEKSEFKRVIDELMPREGDLLHTNTLERFDGDLAHLWPLYREGNILTSFKTISSIAIVDMDQEKIVWCKTGPWVWQHQPTLLPNGNMLLFDNNHFSDHSKVVEYNPFTDQIVWTYMGTPATSFFSKGCGSCQRLGNDNVLVVESYGGRAFEITRDGAIVWEFVNPHSVDQKDETMAYIYDLVRLPASFPLSWTQPPK